MEPTSDAVKAWRRQLRALLREPLPNIVVTPSEDHAHVLHAAFLGAEGTPYDGSALIVQLTASPNYPASPPTAKAINTGLGHVRWHPNVYRDGKLCVSILGTWSGPGWESSMTLSTVLLSIQSLLATEQPALAEPGFEARATSETCDAYNRILQHESARVGLLHILVARASDAPTAAASSSSLFQGQTTLPERLVDILQPVLAQGIEGVCSRLEAQASMDGTAFQDPFVRNIGGVNTGVFAFRELSHALRDAYADLVERGVVEASETEDSDESSDDDGERTES